jgi:hypothetical protein
MRGIAPRFVVSNADNGGPFEAAVSILKGSPPFVNQAGNLGMPAPQSNVIWITSLWFHLSDTVFVNAASRAQGVSSLPG